MDRRWMGERHSDGRGKRLRPRCQADTGSVLSSSPATPRRAKIGRRLPVAAVTLPIDAGAATRPAHPDAELLALCRTFDDLQRQSLATDFDCDSGSPADLAAEAERDWLEAAQDPLVERIADLRATTLPGLIARAQSLAAWDRDLFRDNGPCDPGSLFTHALVRDLLVLGQAANLIRG